MDITELLDFSVKHKASDLHLSAGVPPMVRIDGEVRKLGVPAFSHIEVHRLVFEIMTDAQRRDFEEHLEVEVFAKAGNGKMNGVTLWKHPSEDQKENHLIHKNSVLPVRPVFGKYSTHRMIVHELLNSDVIDKL